MGTTKTAIEEDNGTLLCYVLAIEGYNKLLTSHADTAAVITAWSGTDWSSALTGLQVPGEIEQRMPLLSDEIDISTVEFVLSSDRSDDLAEEVWASEKTSGKFARLTIAMGMNDTTINVDRTGDFASSGTIHIGTEAINYTGTSATQFTGCTRGMWSPFTATDGSTRWSRRHLLSRAKDQITIAPYVTGFRRTWVGRYVALYAHRVLGSTLDTKAQAQLIFAGSIDEITEDSNLRIYCSDLRSIVAKSVLFTDQYAAVPQQGFDLTNVELWFRLELDGSAGFQRTAFYDLADYVSGGTFVTASDLSSAINRALTESQEAGEISMGRIFCGTTAGHGTKMQWNYIGSTDDVMMRLLISWPVALILGFDVEKDSILTSAGHYVLEYTINQRASIDTIIEMNSAFPRGHSVITPLYEFKGSTEFKVESSTGTWFDQYSYLPETISSSGIVDDFTTDVGFLRHGESTTLLAEKASSTSFNLYQTPTTVAWFGGAIGEIVLGGGTTVTNKSITRVTENTEVKQVLLLRDNARRFVKRLFYSTGTSTFNGTFDVYPAQFSLAIPGSLLGDDFNNSLDAAFGFGSTVTVALDGPEAARKVLLPEFLIRNCYLQWRDGKIVFQQPASRSTTTASYSITGGNYALRADEEGSSVLPTCSQSTEYLFTGAKLKHARNSADEGKYTRSLEIRNEQAVSEYGGLGDTLEIEAYNAYLTPGYQYQGDYRRLFVRLASEVLAQFSSPRAIVTRSISRDKFLMTPGDHVSLTDPFIRDPQTGTRGVSGHGAMVLAVRQNWREPSQAEAELMLIKWKAKRAIMSPCADIDEDAAGGGYAADTPSAGKSTITLKAHAYSGSTESVDATHFAAGDELRVVERSCVDPASPVSWNPTVESQSGNTLVLDTNLAGFSSSTKYRVVSRLYSDSVTAQQSDCYAGDTDGQISSARANYVWCSSPNFRTSHDETATTERHEYVPQVSSWYAEGAPVHPGIFRSACDSVTNLISRKTAPQWPFPLDYNIEINSTSYVGVLLFPIFVGTWAQGWKTRKIYAAPRIGIEDAAETVSCIMQFQPTMFTGAVSTGAPDANNERTTLTFTHTGNTTNTIQSVQSVRFKKNYYLPYIYCRVAVKSSSTNVNKGAIFGGIPIFYLGPAEDA